MMSGPLIRARAVVVVAVLCSLVVSAGRLWAGGEQPVGSDPHGKNGSPPRDGVETVVLEELWRAGGDDDSDTFFGLITRVVCDPDGTIYLLDPLRKTVHAYDTGGEALPTLFREGQGPGEITMAFDLCRMSDGSLGALQGYGHSWVKVGRDGLPAGRVETEVAEGVGFLVLFSVVCRGENLVLGIEESATGAKPSAGTRSRVLASYRQDGAEVVRYLESVARYDYDNMVFREKEQFVSYMWSYDVGPDGRVYAPPDRDSYAINVYNADGTIDRVIEREFEPLPRSAESKKRLRQLVDRRYRTAPFEVKYEFEDTEPVFPWYHRGIRVDDNGRLWVRHCRSDVDQPDGVMLTLDVFDAQGQFEKQVAFRCDEDGLYNGFFFAGDDRVVLVKGFVDSMRDQFGGGRGRIGDGTEEQSSGAIEIICYRVR
jgi:hypothetical protein